MQNKKTSPPSRARLYIIIMILLFLVLIFVVIKQGTSSINPTTQPTMLDKDTSSATAGQDGTSFSNISPTQRGAGVITPTRNTTNEVALQPENSSTASDGTPNTTSGGSYARLGCFDDAEKVCTIKKNDDIFSVLGQGTDVEFLINGIKVSPEKIIYQTSSETYPDEQMKDGQGKVITSTNKSYDSTTKTLTISIGANPNYYNNLQPTEQRLLYLSQTVRSFMAMFGDTSENYVKVERAVNALSAWQPTP